MLEPAHGSRRTVSQYENPVIQNWPHLRDISQVSQRFDVIEVNGVEEVSFIAPDMTEPGHYWVVRDSDRRLWHEHYGDNGDGEEGNLKLLEPDAFVCEESSDEDETTSSSSDSGSYESSEGEVEKNSDDEPATVLASLPLVPPV